MIPAGEPVLVLEPYVKPPPCIHNNTGAEDYPCQSLRFKYVGERGVLREEEGRN